MSVQNRGDQSREAPLDLLAAADVAQLYPMPFAGRFLDRRTGRQPFGDCRGRLRSSADDETQFGLFRRRRQDVEGKQPPSRWIPLVRCDRARHARSHRVCGWANRNGLLHRWRKELGSDERGERQHYSLHKAMNTHRGFHRRFPTRRPTDLATERASSMIAAAIPPPTKCACGGRL